MRASLAERCRPLSLNDHHRVRPRAIATNDAHSTASMITERSQISQCRSSVERELTSLRIESETARILGRLEERVTTMELELHTTKRENGQLRSEITKLQKELEDHHTSRLGMGHTIHQNNTHAQESDQSTITNLKATLLAKEDEIDSMRRDKRKLLADVKSGERMQRVLQNQLLSLQQDMTEQQGTIACLHDQLKSTIAALH